MPSNWASPPSGCRSITSPTRDTCRRCRPCSARSRNVRPWPGSARRCCSRRCTIRCAWPRTWPWWTSSRQAGWTSAWHRAISRGSSPSSACPRPSAARVPTRRSRSCSLPGAGSLSPMRDGTSGSTTWWWRRRRCSGPGRRSGSAAAAWPRRGGPLGMACASCPIPGPAGMSSTPTGRSSRRVPGRPGWLPTGCCSRRTAETRHGRSAAGICCTSSTPTGGGSLTPVTTTRTGTS